MPAKLGPPEGSTQTAATAPLTFQTDVTAETLDDAAPWLARAVLSQAGKQVRRLPRTNARRRRLAVRATTILNVVGQPLLLLWYILAPEHGLVVAAVSLFYFGLTLLAHAGPALEARSRSWSDRKARERVRQQVRAIRGKLPCTMKYTFKAGPASGLEYPLATSAPGMLLAYRSSEALDPALIVFGADADLARARAALAHLGAHVESVPADPYAP